MKIRFHGAARTVTGSQHLIQVNRKNLLLDCGLYQGRRKETYERNLRFPFDPRTIDAVLLSHAHIDHSGNLPNLVKQGFEGSIYCTPATRHLTDVMTRDSGHIHEYDSEFINKKRARRGEAAIEPLYTAEDAARAAWQLIGVPYNQTFEPLPGVRATFLDAGHILGSAGISLELEEKCRKTHLMFSGDIGRNDLPILRDPVLPHDIDTLIMECTYGDTPHPPPAQAYEDLQAVIRETYRRGGKVIIPAFAVGRTQALIYYLRQMIQEGVIPRLRVFVDSPLAINVTDIFRQHSECFDRETLAIMRKDPHGSAFGFDLLHYTRSVEESKAINETEEPAVIISASGMAETGRILHHLRNNIEDPRNTILITSWMAPQTLGRRLAEGQKEVKIFGESHHVRARVVSIEGFSAHAGQAFLLNYARAAQGRLKRIFLVHGEEAPASIFMRKLAETGFDRVDYPAPRAEYPL